MADDKKNIPEAAPPAEASAPAVESAVVSEQPAPEPAPAESSAPSGGKMSQADIEALLNSMQDEANK